MAGTFYFPQEGFLLSAGESRDGTAKMGLKYLVAYTPLRNPRPIQCHQHRRHLTFDGFAP